MQGKLIALGMVVGVVLAGQTLAGTVSKAVAQSVQGTKIMNVSLDKVANSNAVQVSIKTSAGQKNIIVTGSHLKQALETLQNPQVIGAQNAAISSHIIHNNSMLLQAVSPVSMKATRPSHAAAVATTAITSANQQASK